MSTEESRLITADIANPWGAEVDWSDTPDGSDWFFIVGLGRTGTTVFAKALSQHPDCYCACEHGVVFSVMGLLLSEAVCDVSCEVFSYAAPRLAKGKRPAWTGTQLRGFAEAWRNAFGEGKARVGDKQVQYLQQLQFFKRLFPGCRFFLTTRHSLDHLSAMLAASSVISGLSYDGSPEGAAGLRSLVRQWRGMEREALRDTAVREVPFAALCGPETIVGQVEQCWQWLGLQPDNAIRPQLQALGNGGHVGRWRSDPDIARILRQGLDDGDDLLAEINSPDW